MLVTRYDCLGIRLILCGDVEAIWISITVLNWLHVWGYVQLDLNNYGDWIAIFVVEIRLRSNDSKLKPSLESTTQN